MSDVLLICDDEDARRAEWKELVSSPAELAGLEIRTLDPVDFGELLLGLNDRRAAAREDRDEGHSNADVLDETRLFVVDRDLFRFNPSVDGEEIAYLARCYSHCGAIVGLNKYGAAESFDLTLIGHLDSFPDINLGGMQIGNPGLWTEPFVGFRPWSWPLLLNLATQIDERAGMIVEPLREPIFSVLSFPEDAATSLPRSTLEQLGPNEDPRDITFHQFVTESEFGLQRKDRVSDDKQLARIAASRLGKWLERSVLPGQDVLIDAPHLVARRPEFLRGDPEAVESWNAVVTMDGARLEDAIDFTSLPPPDSHLSPWLSRPVWWNSAIPGRAQNSETSDVIPDVVFCEDVSRFLPSGAAREFVAQVDSPFARRYVLDGDTDAGRDFLRQEQSRGASASTGSDPSEVAYRPAVRFAL